jgi:nucleoside-diphosphate-sugar epimerase
VKILVIGGTSFFGRDIIEMALDAGHEVTVYSRGNQRPAFWDRIQHIEGDRQDREDFTEKLRGKDFDVVIDNIAFDADDVQNAMQTFAGSIGRYILTSSVAVHMGVGRFDMPVREDEAKLDAVNLQVDTFLLPTSPEFAAYATNKGKAEQVLLNQDAVPYTIIRPPNVVGAEDPTRRCQFYLQRLLDGSPLILTNGGVQSVQLIDRHDLAVGYLAAMNSEKAINQTYHFAHDRTTRLVDWIELLAELADVQPELIAIPADVLQMNGFQYREPWAFTATLTMDMSKAQQELGFTCRPVETWSEELVRWYLDKGNGETSSGYNNRQAELDFIERYRQAVGLLQAVSA